jgi:hypothetical protein
VNHPAVPFSHMYFEGTTGKVGEHLVGYIQTYEDDLPAGMPCASAPFGGIEVEGTLPPGIEMPAGKTEFEGTPYQAGVWEVTVVWHDIGCTQGPDQNRYGDRRIPVRFTIADRYYDDYDY